MSGTRKMSGPHGMVRVRRVEAGLTQEQLAELSGLSVRAISDIERGTTARPRRSSIALIEAALNRFGEDGDTPSSDEAPRGSRGLRSSVPQQLPQAVAGFVGRARELDALTGLLFRSEADCGAVVISAIAGTAGVGKTALAVQWAHRAAERFPDGQLYVNLRGYDPEEPVPAADALARFLRALGVAGQDIPPDADERAALYRSLLAGRRVLVVLDNAGSAEQVRPLLPGSLACGVLVTSRDSLAGLVAREGAARLDLDLLPLTDAVALLRVLIGQRVDAAPAAAEVLAAQCAWLPLALRVAAELATARPDMPLADLVGELADQQRRLDLLEADGDPRAGVRAVFSWSYRNLDAAAARTFRLLGLHPGPDLDLYAAAALTGIDPRQAEQLLQLLARAHLIQPAESLGPDRYDMHDLLRAYARELAAQDVEGERWAALTRLFDHYLHTAAEAMNALFPGERHSRPQVPASASQALPMADPAAARAWLDAERANFAAMAGHAASHDWPEHAIQLAAILFRYLETAGHYPEIVTINTHACRAARNAGNRVAEAEALNNLTLVDLQQGRYEQAGGQLEQALALYRAVGDQTGEARTLGNLGLVRYPQAGDHHLEAAALSRKMGDQSGEAEALNGLGEVFLATGRAARALAQHRAASGLAARIGDKYEQARAHSGLARGYHAVGDNGRARHHWEHALDLYTGLGVPEAGEVREQLTVL